MDARYIAFAIPVFMLAIGLELWVNLRGGDAKYTLHDAIANLSCGIGQQVLLLFFTFFKIGIYTLVFEHARVFTLSPTSVGTWIVAMIGVDFFYWIYHWSGHRVNVLWAFHAVHHQSEEYNLAVALRQSWFTALTSWVFYLPLAVLGVSPVVFVASLTINLLYQFFIHTRAVGKLGPLEWILNTPSHHRVHHGINPEYIDKNYGGILIIWDRLFGTFQQETVEPTYGTVKPLQSWNQYWANAELWVRLAKVSATTANLRDKIWIWFAPPEWLPQDLGGVQHIPEASRETQYRYRVPSSDGTNLYAVCMFVMAIVLTTGLLYDAELIPTELLVAVSALIMMTLATVNGLIEQKSWARQLEVVRLLGFVGLTAWLARNTSEFAVATTVAVAVASVCAIWLMRLSPSTPSGEVASA